jgi:transposase
MAKDPASIGELYLLIDELWERLDGQQQRIDELTAQNARLTEENKQLKVQLEQARTEAARQAAPFRRPERKKVPQDKQKRPGRPVGHPGVNRPVPNHVDEFISVPLEACPHCGGPVADCLPLDQYIEEIPPVRPKVIKLTTYQGHCGQCGDVASTHPLKTGKGYLASKVHLGPRALALAATLNKQHGLSMRKTCRVLGDLCGLKLSAGGLSQALDRLADRLKPDYQGLFVDLRAGPATYVDETSWWVGGPGHWLWVFTSPTTTLYQVEKRRTAAVVTEVLTPNYPGVLVSDCLNIYDTVPFERKHKCIAHHQKAIREQLDSPELRDRTYLENWRTFFRDVSALWKHWHQLMEEDRNVAREALSKRRNDLLYRVELTQPQDKKIRNRLQKQKPFLLTCLNRPDAVEPTNNRAERALRPAVIARKVSCGNKTERGKRTWQVLTSLLATWWQRGQEAVAQLATRAGLVG